MAVAELVRAAGGVISRKNDQGEIEALLVHSPRHREWTFPKGKALPGEPDEACALREVEEETGLLCTLGAELLSTSYRDHKGRQSLPNIAPLHL